MVFNIVNEKQFFDEWNNFNDKLVNSINILRVKVIELETRIKRLEDENKKSL